VVQRETATKKRERKRVRKRPLTADPTAWWPDLTLPAAARHGEGEHNVGQQETTIGAWGRRRAETGVWVGGHGD
jgi:hypothetical protein